MTKKKYYLYYIEIDDVIRYIGMSSDVRKREKQHNYLLNKKDLPNKILYNKLRDLNITQIKLNIIDEFPTELEARRAEALVILMDHFNDQNLWQKVPSLSKFSN